MTSKSLIRYGCIEMYMKDEREKIDAALRVCVAFGDSF